MEILQLKYFMESAKTENFSSTAAKYFVPPSAVSSSVKKLEKELGFSLFDRAPNRIQLNERGRIFYEAISNSFSAVQNTIDKLAPNHAGESKDIKLLIRTERSYIIDKMTQFKEKYRDVVFHLIHEYAAEDYSQYDIIIDEFSNRYGDCKRVPIINENIKIAAARSSTLHGKALRLKDLQNHPFITMSKGSSLNRITHEVCHLAGFEPNIVIESDDPYYIRKYISMDFGIAFFPEKSWHNDTEGIRFLDVADLTYSRTSYIYFNENKNTTRIVRNFFRFLTEDN